LPRHGKPAGHMVRQVRLYRRAAGLAWGSLRRAAGFSRSALAGAVADRVDGVRVVPAEYPTAAGPLASRLQLRRRRTRARCAAARAHPGAELGVALAPECR